MNNKLLTTFLLLVALICVTTAYKTSGAKNGSEQNGFVYLDRFAYNSNPVPDQKRVQVGSIVSEFTFKDKADWGKTITLWQYTDNYNDWPIIYPKKVKCEDKVLMSGANTHEVLQIDANTGKATSTMKALGGVRRRFHFLALVHCGGFGNFDYDMHFTRLGPSWSREFGVNEQGLNSFYIAWFIVYVGIFTAAVVNFKMFQNKEAFVHSLIKLFTASVSLAFVNILSELIHWGAYTRNGVGHPFVLVIGDICEIFASTSFILLLLLLAQGWAISSGLHNSNLQRRKFLIGFLSFFGLFKAIALLLKVFKSNSADVGIGNGVIVFWNCVLIFELIFAVFYVISLASTMKQETNPVKHRFMKLLFVFTLYIIATAATALISFLLDPWVREFLINFVAVLTLTFAQCAMLYLLWYTRSARYFELNSPTELVNDDLNYENF